ncbi:MAG: hypothetical protein RH942_03375 [Kiloniellaceae bacterium]
MIWRIFTLAALLLLAGLPHSRAALAQTGTPDEVSGKLIYSIAPEQMELLLVESGFTALQKLEPLRWILRSPGGYTMVMNFVGCKEDRCEGARLRAVWPLGQRDAALKAVRFYEDTVAIAHVSLQPSQQGFYLLVGRDIWLLPGRTLANVATQLEQVDFLAGTMTEHLVKNDPGIAEFWQQVQAR